MGNCANKQHGEEEEEGLQTMSIAQVLLQEEEGEPAAGVKVKVVLTRAEVEWLMAQLESGGEQRLEDVLHQMGAARHRPPPPHRHGWRPRLERIAESTAAAAGGART